MNELDVIQWLEDRDLKAVVMEYQNDGVRVVKFWDRWNQDCKTMTYDPRWDSKKTDSKGGNSSD